MSLLNDIFNSIWYNNKGDDVSKILLVEDNDVIILGLEYLLKEENFEYSVVKNKRDTLCILDKEKFDVVLLDISLPDGSGFDLCKYIKEKKNTAVIFLTAKDEEKDVVLGFDLGADDYIIKPFRNRELISRIKNVLKRNEKADNSYIANGNIRIDVDLGKVYKNEKEIMLTKLEYKILLNLFSNRNKLITREEILNDIWDIAGNFVNDNTLTVYIKRIREKIGDKEGKIIETVRGLGYRIN